ncbi:lipase family protein [Pseudomonas faucium]|uniref:lipase family protein n=1 Tax=Pseudomonas faucium TaxID=2740518 RepID=UPI001F1C4207|nr:lipase family protein [Pseudomonas faucium]
MNEFLHRTDTLGSSKVVICGKQKTHWLEFQLLDERGEPLVNIPYRAENDATRAACAPVYTGVSDAQGVIRLEGLHPIRISLKLSADPLAEQLSTRRLRAERPEPARPGIGNPTPLHGPQRSGFSPIEDEAQAAGHGYHYLRIGQLCDQLPTFHPPLENRDTPPPYHFPDTSYSGFSVEYEGLNRRHVLEVCPLRAWSLVLHHQRDYSLANAYNLGLMSILSYSKLPALELGSVAEFFELQCTDLSRTPRVWDNGQAWPCLVTDVPFSDRYTVSESLDTSQAEPPEGHTQLFYAISATQLLVAWRGTETDGVEDLITDLAFRPVPPQAAASCEPSVPCPDLATQGRVHLGFRNGFEVARKIYSMELGRVIPEVAKDRSLFICGHSLGGALGLIHAASLKELKPVLHTYGMPRTFTLKAAQSLSGLLHFRHVNDSDVVPRVPPEADLDSHLYKLYGPLGTSLGFAWSIMKLSASALVSHGDPFSHHGEIALFYVADQHVQRRGSQFPAYLNKEGLGAPYHTTVSHRLQEKAKLYLVPSLDEADSFQAEEAQKRLINSLDKDGKDRFFKPYGNPRIGARISITNHFMSEYQPYLHNQLLESINPHRIHARQLQRKKFEKQMEDNSGRIPADELSRNRRFLDMHNRIERALQVTRSAEGGEDALQRFDLVTNPEIYYEKMYS